MHLKFIKKNLIQMSKTNWKERQKERLNKTENCLL